MRNKIVIDLGQIMDEIFEATQNFGGAFKDGFKFHKEGNPFCRWDENVDYYPAYSYPPANVYITKDKTLVFEFALSGFTEEQINLEFRGEYMVLSATLPEDRKDPEDVKYFKRRLKFKNIAEQKYYAPGDKFDREKVSARYKNGVLTVMLPPKEEFTTKEGIKIEIVKEDEK